MAETSTNKVVFGRRTFLKGSLAASALLALSACKKGDDKATSAGGKKGGTLRWYISNPKSIDPYNMQESEGTIVGYQLFDGLTNWDYDKSELVSLCAEKWEASKDATEFTFTLKKGIKFHNGDEVDSQSFKRGWERICNPKTDKTPSAISYHLALVEGYDDLVAGKSDKLPGLSCPDKYTFKVKLSAPYADFPIVCSHPALVPVPEVALKDFQTFFLAPIGNGPFKMDGKWVDGQHISLKRFDDYYGDKPLLDGIYFNIQKDLETAFREFEAGNLDYAAIPTARLKETIKKYGEAEKKGYAVSPKHQTITGDNTAIYYIFFNNKKAPFNDPELRRALSLAVNRQSICDKLFEGTRKPAGGVIPPAIAGYEQNSWKYSHYDRAEAEKILDAKYPKDANGKRNIKVSLTFNLDGGHKDIMESVMSDWKALGVDVTPDTKDWSTCLADYQAFKSEAGRLGWNADYPIIDNFVYPLFYSKSGDNLSGFNDPEIDKLINDARSIVDVKERIAAFQKINRKIGEAAPLIPIMFYKFGRVVSDKVKTLTMRPDGNVNMEKTELVG